MAHRIVGGPVSASNGTVTNLNGTQTNAAFGITTLVFTSTASSAAITFTRNGGSFVGIPMSGIQLTTAFVPEPVAISLVVSGVVGVLAVPRRRPRSTARCHGNLLGSGRFQARPGRPLEPSATAVTPVR